MHLSKIILYIGSRGSFVIIQSGRTDGFVYRFHRCIERSDFHSCSNDNETTIQLKLRICIRLRESELREILFEFALFRRLSIQAHLSFQTYFPFCVYTYRYLYIGGSHARTSVSTASIAIILDVVSGRGNIFFSCLLLTFFCLFLCYDTLLRYPNFKRDPVHKICTQQFVEKKSVYTLCNCR